MSRKPYPSDLTNAQWKLIAPLIPAVKPGGRPRKYDMREVANALLYVNREGCSWRALPHDLPHWKTAYNFFRAFEADGTWDRLVAALRVTVREKLGRDPTPSGGCIDSQSAKTAHGGAAVIRSPWNTWPHSPDGRLLVISRLRRSYRSANTWNSSSAPARLNDR